MPVVRRKATRVARLEVRSLALEKLLQVPA